MKRALISARVSVCKQSIISKEYALPMLIVVEEGAQTPSGQVRPHNGVRRLTDRPVDKQSAWNQLHTNIKISGVVYSLRALESTRALSVGIT